MGFHNKLPTCIYFVKILTHGVLEISRHHKVSSSRPVPDDDIIEDVEELLIHEAGVVDLDGDVCGRAASRNAAVCHHDGHAQVRVGRVHLIIQVLGLVKLHNWAKNGLGKNAKNHEHCTLYQYYVIMNHVAFSANELCVLVSNINHS